MIETKDLTVRYGNLIAVNKVSLSLGKGELFGYIGPNGAGKSTTMKVLACLLKPDGGTASIDGKNVTQHSDEIRRIVGYMPDFLGVYDDLTVDEYLQFFAAAFRIPRKQRRTLIDGVLELTDLTGKKNAMVDSLSRGMQQRLGVARVLIHDPKVLLLDEPASGLDPRARIEMRSLLVELRNMGKTIIVSSHILSELHDMCTSIGIIERGSLIYAGSIDDAISRTKTGERILLRLESMQDSAAEALRADKRIASVRQENSHLDITLSPDVASHHFLIEMLVHKGYHIQSFTPQSVKLEDVFLKLTKGAVQ